MSGPIDSAGSAVSEIPTAPEPTPLGQRIGLLLAPIAGLLLVVEIIYAIGGVQHFIHFASYPRDQNGISSGRRQAGIIYSIVVGAIGPIVVAFIWFDWAKTKMSARSRLAMIGYVGCIVGLMALWMTVGIDLTST